MSDPTRASSDVRRLERIAAAAAAASIVGLALVGTGESAAGTVLTLGGLVALMFAIHKYGRLGTEGPSRQRQTSKRVAPVASPPP